MIGLYQWIWYSSYMKRNLKYYLISLLIPIICLAGFQSYKWYDNRIPKLSDQVDIIKYQPFKEKSPNPLLANLATPATVNFTADLPQIDCATALYPLASSFVEAVYPTNIDYYPYQQNGTSPLLVSQTPLAYENLLNKKVDIIFVSGPSKKQEIEANEKGAKMVLTPIGKEGFVFLLIQKIS